MAITELLSDYRWHPYDEAIIAGARAVPPGVAYRRGEQIRANGRKRRNVTDPQPWRATKEGAISLGARQMGRDAVKSGIRHQQFEMMTQDDVIYVRLKRDRIKVEEIIAKNVDGRTQYWLLCEDGYVRPFGSHEVFVKVEDRP